MTSSSGTSIQLVGGPHDGQEVPDDGRKEWLIPVPIDMPLMLSTIGPTEVATTFRRGVYERVLYVSPDRPARPVMIWRGIR